MNGLKELWDNFTQAIDTIKNLVFGFIDIVGLAFSLVPSPFSEILGVASLVIIALIVRKIVKG